MTAGVPMTFMAIPFDKRRQCELAATQVRAVQTVKPYSTKAPRTGITSTGRSFGDINISATLLALVWKTF
jgi:hypothetical protein